MILCDQRPVGFRLSTSLFLESMKTAPQRFHLIILSLAMFLVLGGCESGDSGGNSQPNPLVEEQSSGRSSSTSPNDRPSSDRQILPDEQTIVAFGDSLTAGLGLSQNQAYPAQLQRRLIRADYPYRVINAGVNGDTTAGGVRRLDWILENRPSIVILELGANDGLRGLPLEDTESNLEIIIQRFQEAGATVILGGMKIPPNYGPEYTNRFASMYESLAREYRLLLIPFFLEGVATNPSLNQPDGIHPTAEGYAIVVENVMNVLEPLLKK